MLPCIPGGVYPMLLLEVVSIKSGSNENLAVVNINRFIKLSPRFVVRNVGGSLFQSTLVLPTNACLPPIEGAVTRGRLQAGWQKLPL